MTKKMCRNDEIMRILVLLLIRNAFEKKELSLKGAYLLGCRDWSLGSSPSGTTKALPFGRAFCIKPRQAK